MAVRIDGVGDRVIGSEIHLYEAFASMYSRRRKECMATVIRRDGIGILQFQYGLHNSGVLVREGHEQWDLALLSWRGGAEVFPFQEHLGLPFTPGPSGPRQW